MDNKEVKETSWQNETCDRRFYKTIVAFLSNLLIIVERVYRYICIYIYMDVNYFSKMKKKNIYEVVRESFFRSRWYEYLCSSYRMFLHPVWFRCWQGNFFFFISCDNWKRYQNRRRKKKWKMRTRNYKSKEKYV